MYVVNSLYLTVRINRPCLVFSPTTVSLDILVDIYDKLVIYLSFSSSIIFLYIRNLESEIVITR